MRTISKGKGLLPASAWLALATLAGSFARGGEMEPSFQDQPQSRQEILLEKRRQKMQDLKAEQVSKWENVLIQYEKRPIFQKLTVKGYQGFRLVVGGLPQGSGFAYGVGYVNGLDRESVRFTVDARYSSRRYERLDAMAEFFPKPASDSPWRGFVKAGYLDYKSHNFFGIGNFTSDEDESSFRLEQRHAAAGLSYRANRRLKVSGEVGFLDTGIRPGEDDPSPIAVLGAGQVPGFFEQPQYLTYGGQVEVSLFDRWEAPPVGVAIIASVKRFDGRGGRAGGQVGSGSFLRASGEVQLRVPLGHRNRRIAYRLRTSHSMADGDAEVPFFLLETLGGAHSLRGYEEFRFRDARNLTMNLEYRWEVWTFADMALFSDAGKVFRRAGDLDFSDLHASYGAGIIFRPPGGFRLRFDVARSQEGIRFHIGSGPNF